MKFTIQRKTLLSVLGHVVPVSDAKSTMPILGNVHLATDKDRLLGCLTASATNLEITATTDEHVSVDEAGSLCLPAKALLDRVKAMPEGEITFLTKDVTATLKAKGAARKFTLSGVPSAEFPKLPEWGIPDWSHEMPALELAELIASTAFSVSTDETRLHLNSLCFETIGDAVRCVSTDGHRLSVMTFGQMPDTAKRQMLIPRDAVMRIKALIEGHDKEVRLACCKLSLWVTCNDFNLCVKLADAQFPPYEQVIPKESELRVELNRTALLSATKAVRVSAPDSQGVHLEISSSKIKLTAQSADGGEGVDEIDCQSGPAKARTYGLNCDYLIQALDAISTESVTMKLSGELDPIVIEPIGSKREQTLCLMPMRI
jgi:DNA polymerase III subunit beta